ncbi:hypothetical protein [Pseudomonas putida]|uniref:hypothetical protein n=1 Tax=Pseudomonas putida TaxID=303 RepID=UPI000281E34C|nr:hypothetical protein [Pseudomonas putida]EMR47973.1 hypothetical protein PPUTLS46_009024 [Pseudomonas putida LS46]
MLQVVGQESDISAAINDFNASYHNDFVQVRKASQNYLKTLSPPNAEVLADALQPVLMNWGANKRKAPVLRSASQAAVKLSNPKLHAALVRLNDHTLNAFEICSEGQRRFALDTLYTSLSQFDTELLEVLRTLAEAQFSNNTNVTYPMKALLLITGFMPALDSQVRKGLQRAGLQGFSSTRYLLPRDTNKAAGQKLCLLPFSLGHCWSLNKDLLTQAIKKSDHPTLNSEPGRVFDILLFMQSDPKRKLILALK